LVLLVLSGCTHEPSAHADCTGVSDCRPPLTLKTLAGPPLGEDLLGGKVVLVNFWATWCAPCARELPALQAVYGRHKDDGFTIVGIVSGDRATDDAVVAFASGRQVDYPLVRGGPDLERRFEAGDALPTSLLYDRHGHLVKRWLGAIDEAALEDLVKQSLVQ